MPETTALLRILAQGPNQAILNMLAIEPSYPRKIGGMLSLPETEVARRLRRMEGQGLVRSDWAFIGKNVKLYELAIDGVDVLLLPQGVNVAFRAKDGAPARTLHTNHFRMHVPEPDGFFGRERELAAVRGQEPVVWLHGLPGSGKTSLAAQAVRSGADDRPVFWHTLRGFESVDWLANRVGLFLAQHGRRSLFEAVEAGIATADKRELLLDEIANSDATFVFDDAHRIDDEAIREVLLDAVDRQRAGKLILVGRERPLRPAIEGRVVHLQVGGLDDEAVRSICAARGVDVPTSLLPAMRQEVGGHPLAVNLFLEAVKELGVKPENLLDRVPERNLEEYLLKEIHDALDDDERRVLALASLFRGSFEERDVAGAASRSVAGGLIKARKRLLVQTSGDQHSLHEIVRNFFYARLEDKPKLHTRLAEHYLGKRTLESRLEAYHHFIEAGRKDRVLQLLGENLDLREFDLLDSGYHTLYLRILQRIDRSDVRDARLWALVQDEKGDILFHRGEYEAALAFYEEASQIFLDAHDRVRTADLAWKRAMALERSGNRALARRICKDALEMEDLPRREAGRLEELASQLAVSNSAKKT